MLKRPSGLEPIPEYPGKKPEIDQIAGSTHYSTKEELREPRHIRTSICELDD